MLLRFSLFNSFLLALVGYSWYFYDAPAVLWSIDSTKFSFLILAIYAAATAYLGIWRRASNFDFVHFIANRLTSIGLVGTVVGIMLLMGSVGSAPLSDVSAVVGPLFKGMSTVLVTTLFGMASSLLLDFQVAFVFGKRHDESTD